jgi:hypothetical protein
MGYLCIGGDQREVSYFQVVHLEEQRRFLFESERRRIVVEAHQIWGQSSGGPGLGGLPLSTGRYRSEKSRLRVRHVEVAIVHVIELLFQQPKCEDLVVCPPIPVRDRLRGSANSSGTSRGLRRLACPSAAFSSGASRSTTDRGRLIDRFLGSRRMFWAVMPGRLGQETDSKISAWESTRRNVVGVTTGRGAFLGGPNSRRSGSGGTEPERNLPAELAALLSPSDLLSVTGGHRVW